MAGQRASHLERWGGGGCAEASPTPRISQESLACWFSKLTPGHTITANKSCDLVQRRPEERRRQKVSRFMDPSSSGAAVLTRPGDGLGSPRGFLATPPRQLQRGRPGPSHQPGVG